MRRLVLGIAVAVTSLMPVIGMADDQQIADFIKSRLKAEQQQGNLHGFNVDMRVESGIVSFKGYVSNSTQEMTILRTAQQAGHLGVVKVVDDIDVSVSPTTSATTEEIKEPVETTESAAETAIQTIPQIAEDMIQQPVEQVSQDQFEPQTVGQLIPQADDQVSQQPVGQLVSQPYAQMVQQPMVGQMSQQPVGQMSQQPVGQMVAQPYAQSNQVPAGQINQQPVPYQQISASTMGMPANMHAGNIPMNGGQPVGYPNAGNPNVGRSNTPVPYASNSGMQSQSPNMPPYAWPGYAANPNYAAVSYPKQYSPSAWPYIGPFYPYPQVPLGWRKVSLEWDDGWWMLDFHDK